MLDKLKIGDVLAYNSPHDSNGWYKLPMVIKSFSASEWTSIINFELLETANDSWKKGRIYSIYYEDAINYIKNNDMIIISKHKKRKHLPDWL